MYVRHLAWLRAVPDDVNPTGTHKISQRFSRLDVMNKREIPVEMPDVEGYELLLEWLAELGYSDRGLNGLDPLTYSDVQAWSEVSENSLTPWMKIMLVDLSRDYCHQANISLDSKCKAPYETTIEDDDLIVMRQTVDTKIRSLFN